MRSIPVTTELITHPTCRECWRFPFSLAISETHDFCSNNKRRFLRRSCRKHFWFCRISFSRRVRWIKLLLLGAFACQRLYSASFIAIAQAVFKERGGRKRKWTRRRTTKVIVLNYTVTNSSKYSHQFNKLLVRLYISLYINQSNLFSRILNSISLLSHGKTSPSFIMIIKETLIDLLNLPVILSDTCVDGWS